MPFTLVKAINLTGTSFFIPDCNGCVSVFAPVATPQPSIL